MLSYLKIENIARIEKAEIEFSGGFNVLSGETGAGKSIILDSISAVLGFRTSRELIRSGEKEASVTAVFTAISNRAKQKLLSLEIEQGEDGTLILSRVIGQDKNICKINATAVTVSVLRELGSCLINIHGQQDSRDLLDDSKHLFYLDRVADDAAILSEMEKLYLSYTEVEKEIESLTISDEKKARLTDMLEYEINELTLAGISVGEREQLRKRRACIQNAEKLEQLINEAKSALCGDGELRAYEFLSQAAGSLAKAAEVDGELEAIANDVTEAMYAVQSAAEELRDSFTGLDFNTNEMADIEERLDLLYRLGRKYGNSEQEMITYLERAREKLDSLNFSEEKIKRLREINAETLELCMQTALKLSEKRKKASAQFEIQVSKELEFLDMPYVKFKTLFQTAPLSASGTDAVCFLISANVGEDLKPVAKIASGGELSRIMLSFKSVLSDKDGIDTLIFDEIDSGVSGKAALKVGQKLKAASKNRQVICVTHLSQIAAFADTHFLTEKKTEGNRTQTFVSPLDFEGRKRELARITGGGEITDNQLKNAEELLEYGRNNS